jgi:hypothetical protein
MRFSILYFLVLSFLMARQRGHILIPSVAGRFPHSVQIPAAIRCWRCSRFACLRSSRRFS